MSDRKWIKTSQMLDNLRSEPGEEQQYAHWLGGILFSTHWLVYDAEKNLFGDSMNWSDFEWYTKEEFSEHFSGHWWMREH